jgi:hypothetical protein
MLIHSRNMNKVLLILNRAVLSIALISVLSTSQLVAQVPDYFANNPAWKMNSAFGANGPCVTEIDYVLYVSGDTVIGPNTYKKMRTRGTYHFIFVISPGCSSTDYYADNLYMLVRQDSTRIWKYNGLGDNLLYDFNLQIGDTIPLGELNCCNDSIVVDSISTIMVGSSLRKVFHLSADPPLQLIEGVAALNPSNNEGGFLVGFPPCFECLQQFSCFAMNDTVQYPGFMGPCNLNVDIEQESENQSVIFYPNPVEDLMILKLSGNDMIQIDCSNLLGEHFQIPFEQISTEKWQLNTSDLNRGMYFVRIQQGSNQFSIKMFKE